MTFIANHEVVENIDLGWVERPCGKPDPKRAERRRRWRGRTIESWHGRERRRWHRRNRWRGGNRISVRSRNFGPVTPLTAPGLGRMDRSEPLDVHVRYHSRNCGRGVKERVRKMLIKAMGLRNQSKQGLVMAMEPERLSSSESTLSCPP